MGTNLESVKARIWQYLRDELSSSVTAHTFSEGELDGYVQRANVEVSEASPYETKVTSLTISDDKEVDISTLKPTLLEVICAEYKVAQNPKQLREVSQWGDTLTVKYGSTPTDADTCYLYCHQLHEIERASSTMSQIEEDSLVLGASIYAAQSWLAIIRTEIADAVALVTTVETAVGNMTARITQAVSDLASSRAAIGSTGISDPIREYQNLAGNELASAGGYLNQALGYLRGMSTQLSEPRAITQYQSWINTQLAQYRDRLRRITKNRTSQEYARD